MVKAYMLRSIGQQLHPVGTLQITNMVQNPNCSMADGSNNLLNFTVDEATFKKDLTQFKFGNSSGKFTVTTLFTIPYVYQRFEVNELQTYVASMYVNIPSDLSTPINIIGRCYAADNTPIAIDSDGNFDLGGQVLNGAATSGWIRTSINLPVVAGTKFMDVYFIYAENPPTSLDSFYVDGLQLEPPVVVNPGPQGPQGPIDDPDSNDPRTPGQYNDGDMSGYIWAGEQGVSYTLQSQFPSAFHSFDKGALHGAPSGMIAHATMTRPNVITLQN